MKDHIIFFILIIKREHEGAFNLEVTLVLPTCCSHSGMGEDGVVGIEPQVPTPILPTPILPTPIPPTPPLPKVLAQPLFLLWIPLSALLNSL